MEYVVVAVVSKNNKYLLINSRKDYGKFTGYFYPPGGHLDPGESEKEALTREIKEELNTSIKLIEKIAQTGGDVANQTTHWWKCDIEIENVKLNTDELGELIWLSRDEILNHPKVWPATKKFFEKYIQK